MYETSLKINRINELVNMAFTYFEAAKQQGDQAKQYSKQSSQPSGVFESMIFALAGTLLAYLLSNIVVMILPFNLPYLPPILAVLTGIYAFIRRWELIKRNRKYIATDLAWEGSDDLNKGRQIITDNQEDFRYMHPDYWYPYATDYMRDLIDNQGVASILEALELYEAHLTSLREEDENEELVRQIDDQVSLLQMAQDDYQVQSVANIAMVRYENDSRGIVHNNI